MINKVVCISSINWYPIPTRKQQIMSRLPNSEVIYFDPPVTLIAPFKDKKTLKRLFMWIKQGQQIPQENILVYALPPVLPFYNKFRFINKINQFFIGHFIQYIINKKGWNNENLPDVWCYMPQSADAIKRVNHKKLVYDCVDRHSAYKGLINPKVVDKMEEDFCGQCDVVFSTADGLHQTLSKYNKNAFMIPNGVNYDLFTKASTGELTVPPEIRAISGPVIGFVGMLQECIDYNLIETILKRRNNYTVVFIGEPLPGVNIEHLKKYPNALFLGLKPQKELPNYLSGFDVCLNTFQAGDLSKDVSPLKFYEYLATGKPIISTPQPLQVLNYADVIYIANTPEEMLFQCDKAISETDDGLRQRRLIYAKSCSWDARVKQMIDIIGRVKGDSNGAKYEKN